MDCVIKASVSRGSGIARMPPIGRQCPGDKIPGGKGEGRLLPVLQAENEKIVRVGPLCMGMP